MQVESVQSGTPVARIRRALAKRTAIRAISPHCPQPAGRNSSVMLKCNAAAALCSVGRERCPDTARFETRYRGLARRHPLREIALTETGRFTSIADLVTDAPSVFANSSCVRTC